MQYVALVLFFTFCQVIGTMCVLPDLAVAQEAAWLVEDPMACPMEGTTMCPPSVTSSPERQMKHSMVVDVTHAAALPTLRTLILTPSVETQWSRSRAFSLVRPLIVDLPVLRI